MTADGPAPAATLVSLVVCTIGRTDPLRRLLRSLREQRGRALEVLVVDQNPEGFLAPVLDAFGDLPIVRCRSAKGLSRARNVGLARARGTIVGFPDDDCWYGPDVVETVAGFFARRPEIAVLTGRTVDAAGAESVSAHLPRSGPIDRSNVFGAGNSNGLFLRREAALAVGGFDETLGVGAGTAFQSGEETDLLLRCLAQGYGSFFDRDLLVFHDQNDASADVKGRRVRSYSVGFGRVARLHEFGPVYLGTRISRAVLRGTACLASGDIEGARQRGNWIIGSLRGYMAPLERARRS